jgi:uncharacterized protein YxeA
MSSSCGIFPAGASMAVVPILADAIFIAKTTGLCEKVIVPQTNQHKIIMKKMFLTLAAVVAFAAAATSLRAEDKSYQVTGPVVEITKDYIVVKKGEANWHLAIDKSTKTADVKVGDKVTVYYTMTATEIESKAAKAPKKEKMK